MILLGLPVGPAAPEPMDAPPAEERPPETKPVSALRLPEEAPLAPEGRPRRELRDGINRLARTLGVPQAEGLTDAEMVAMLGRIDAKLGERPARKVGDPSSLKDPRSLIRVLLWEHGVDDYAEPTLNNAELVERLEKLLPKGNP